MPQLEVHTLLRLAEKAGELAMWDLETSGLGADYQSIVLASIKPYHKPPITYIADRFNKDKKLVRVLKKELEKFTVLVAHNGKMFDIPFLNTRLLYWGLEPLNKRHHLDTYQTLRYKLRTSSKSQAALLSFLRLPQQKMGLPPSVWQDAWTNKDAMKQLIERCETDCIGLEQLFDKTKHLIRNIEAV